MSESNYRALKVTLAVAAIFISWLVYRHLTGESRIARAGWLTPTEPMRAGIYIPRQQLVVDTLVGGQLLDQVIPMVKLDVAMNLWFNLHNNGGVPLRLVGVGWKESRSEMMDLE